MDGVERVPRDLWDELKKALTSGKFRDARKTPSGGVLVFVIPEAVRHAKDILVAAKFSDRYKIAFDVKEAPQPDPQSIVLRELFEAAKTTAYSEAFLNGVRAQVVGALKFARQLLENLGPPPEPMDRDDVKDSDFAKILGVEDRPAEWRRAQEEIADLEELLAEIAVFIESGSPQATS